MLSLESTKNFESNPLLKPMGMDCSNFVNYDQVQVLNYNNYSCYIPVVGIETANSRRFHLEELLTKHLSLLCPAGQFRVNFGDL